MTQPRIDCLTSLVLATLGSIFSSCDVNCFWTNYCCLGVVNLNFKKLGFL